MFDRSLAGINGSMSADKVGLHQSRGQRDTNLRGFLERLLVVVLSGGYPMGFKWRMTLPSLKPTVRTPQKMDGWKTSFLLGWLAGRCYVQFQ